MRRMQTMLVCLAALAAATAHAAYLKEDFPNGQPPGPTAPPIVRPVPTSNPLTELVQRTRVQHVYHYRGLTVYVIALSRVTHPTDYLTSQEALADGALVVREKPDAVVPRLVLENNGKRPVLLLGGEMLVGGKQNRVLGQDVLLGSRSGPVEVPVSCVEERRWAGPQPVFGRTAPVAALAVRSAAQSGEGQASVWREVRRYQETLKAESATHDMSSIQYGGATGKELADFRQQFRRNCWRRAGSGMVVARWGTIVGADLFANPMLFAKHRDRLLDSYAADCIAHGAGRDVKLAPEAPDAREAEAFLRRVLRAEVVWGGSPGSGRALNVRGAGIRGAALVLEADALHVALFADREVIVGPRPVPLPVPGPMPEPRPR